MYALFFIEFILFNCTFSDVSKCIIFTCIYLLTIPIQPGLCLKVLIPVRTDMLNMKLHVLVNVLITIH